MITKKVFRVWALKTFLSLESFDLLNLPDIVGFQQLLEVVVLLLGADLSELSVNGIVVGGSIDIADNTQSYGETVAITHEGKLQLQGVVLTVSIVNEYVVDGVAVLANFYHLQTEALLYESELIVLTEHELLTVLHIDSILLTSLLVIDGLVTAVVEDNAVLQYLSDAGTLMLVGRSRARQDGTDPQQCRRGST